MEFIYQQGDITLYKTILNEDIIQSMKDYCSQSSLVKEYNLKVHLDENLPIYLFYNQEKEIIGHSIVRPIENQELILVYDFADISWYPLGDDLEVHGTFISTLEFLAPYKEKGLGQQFFRYIQSIIQDKFILKSVNGSKPFWEKQGFEVIYDSEFEEAYWMVLDND